MQDLFKKQNMLEHKFKVRPEFSVNGAFGEIILVLKSEDIAYKFAIAGNYADYMMEALYFCKQKTSDYPTNLSYREFLDEIDTHMMVMRTRYWYIHGLAVDKGILKSHYSSLPPGWYHVTSSKDNTGETEVLGPMEYVKEIVKIEQGVKLGPISRFFHRLGL